MSHISANNIDMKLIIVFMSMFSGSMNQKYGNYIVPAIVFSMDATFYVILLHYLNTAAQNNAKCGFFNL